MSVRRRGFFMFLMKDDRYERKIPVIKELERTHKRICYVCLSDTASSVSEELTTRGLDRKKFVFVDTLSSYYGKKGSEERCKYVSSPFATREIIDTVLRMRGRCDVFVFDTISELLVYHDTSSVLRFTHDVITKDIGKIVYMVPERDSVPQRDVERLINDLVMFADKTTKLNDNGEVNAQENNDSG